MIINYINNKFLKLTLRYLTYRFNKRFESIKNKTGLINNTVSLDDIYNHIVNVYHVEYNEHGLRGLWKMRKTLLAQISNLSINNLFNKDKPVSDVDLKESLKHFYNFKDILGNIKYTIELFLAVKIILSFVSKAASIPFLVLWLWNSVVKLFRIFSYGTTAYMAKWYVETQTEQGSKIGVMIDWLRRFSINLHNFLFGDNIPSTPRVPDVGNAKFPYPQFPGPFGVGERGGVEVITAPMKSGTPVKSHTGIWNYIPSTEWIDWSIVGYTTATVAVVGTAYLVYTGVIEPMPLANRAWKFLVYYFVGEEVLDPSTAVGDGARPYTPDIVTEDLRSNREPIYQPSLSRSSSTDSLAQPIVVVERAVAPSFPTEQTSGGSAASSTGSLTPTASSASPLGVGPSSTLPVIPSSVFIPGLGLTDPKNLDLLTEEVCKSKDFITKFTGMTAEGRDVIFKHLPHRTEVINESLAKFQDEISKAGGTNELPLSSLPASSYATQGGVGLPSTDPTGSILSWRAGSMRLIDLIPENRATLTNEICKSKDWLFKFYQMPLEDQRAFREFFPDRWNAVVEGTREFRDYLKKL